MTEIKLEAMKDRLEKEKLELEDTLAKHGQKDSTGAWQADAVDDFETDPADENEVADKMEELSTNIPIVEELEEQYNDVILALEKIKNGNYGLCESGGEPISPDRLNANPAARTCVAHAK
jgi:RNA polymerase-binding transcription factor DksA